MKTLSIWIESISLLQGENGLPGIRFLTCKCQAPVISVSAETLKSNLHLNRPVITYLSEWKYPFICATTTKYTIPLPTESS